MNFTLSDVPSNMDYSFRAGIFMGDYNNVAIRPRREGARLLDGRAQRALLAFAGLPEPAVRVAGGVLVDSCSSNMGGQKTQNPSLDAISAFSVRPYPPDMLDPRHPPRWPGR